MIQSYLAATEEIDDLELAVSEITEQLDLANNMRKNTLGVIVCNYEFAFSGALKAICDALPFNTVGTITTGQGSNVNFGGLLFSIMMLTSDDVAFKTFLTESLIGDYSATIERAYSQAASDVRERPSLLYITSAFLYENYGDAYVDALTKASNGAPCFGTLAVDDTNNLENCFMIYNGEYYRDRMAVTMFLGDIDPKFYIATLSEDKILSHSALITESEGHILKKVDGRPLLEYFDKLGLKSASETNYAMASLPFLLDFNDGTPPISRVFVDLTPERHGICAGLMPEGSTLYIGVFDKQDVLFTTTEAVKKALSHTDHNNFLMYSCVARHTSMAGDFSAELDAVKETIGEGKSFMMAYSGGEICPTQINDGKAINRFHNNAFILCAFK